MSLFNFNTICNLAAGVLAAGLLAYLVRLFIGRSTRGVPRCLRCDYNMAGHADAAAPACPECGRVHRSGKQLYQRRRSRRRIAIVVVLLLLLPGTLTYAPLVRQRMQQNKETFTQAVTPTTAYCLCLPWLGDRGRSVLAHRDGSTSFMLAGMTPPNPSAPQFVHAGFFDEYWPIQRHLLIWQCGRMYRDPSSNADTRALALEWMNAAAGSDDSQYPALSRDWDMVLLALRDKNLFIRGQASMTVQQAIYGPDDGIGHTSAFRAAVVQACVADLSDPNAAGYPLLALSINVCEVFGKDALPLADPLLKLSTTLTDAQQQYSEAFELQRSSDLLFSLSPSFCFDRVQAIGPAAWEPIARFFETSPRLAAIAFSQQFDPPLSPDSADAGDWCVQAIEWCFLRTRVAGLFGKREVYYRSEILGEETTRCLAWLDQRAAAADPRDAHNEAQGLAAKLRIARELMRMQERVTVDEVEARWRRQAEEN